MKKISSMFYLIGQGFVGVFRNGVMTTASLLVLVSCMLIVGTFYIVIDNIDKNLKSSDRINIINIWLPDELEESEIEHIETKIKDISKELGNIEQWERYSKEENLEKFKERAGEDTLEFLKDKDINPLPASIEIHFTSFSDPKFNMDDVYKLKQRLLGIEGLSDENVKEDIELYNKVTGLNKTLTLVALWMMIILLVVSLFVIMNTIRLGLHARRNEINFMRYCGATKSFVRTPFLIEGVLIGIASAAIALGLQYYIYEYIIVDVIPGAKSFIYG